jgi:hypothetical protein
LCTRQNLASGLGTSLPRTLPGPSVKDKCRTEIKYRTHYTSRVVSFNVGAALVAALRKGTHKGCPYSRTTGPLSPAQAGERDGERGDGINLYARALSATSSFQSWPASL